MASKDSRMLEGYPFQRDFTESIRLYIQHWMWRRQLGYLLHPAIPTKENLNVADIACGTGIWLLDLAKERPSASLEGFDISAAQFPPSAWLPKNVTMKILDILKPIPQHLRGKYDVVHVGLLVLVVEKDDPRPLLNNLLLLLKPGGYLQWDEADFGGLYVQTPSSEISHAALDDIKSRIHGTFLAAKGTTFSWVRQLQTVFEEQQIAVLDNKFLPIEDDIARPWTLQHLMAITEMIKSIQQSNGDVREWQRLYEKVSEEIHCGASMRMAMVSIVGQKAYF